MMEEEVGIKGTRLRRRLSIEAEDVRSPSTPTKKRSGRLAAKPQLELIDENVPDLIPNKTTKAREIAAEEKVLTPSRRSSRIRSNTSILSETLEVEEKVTPAKRTTRAKSNTSLVAEVSGTTPRAKRAARRNSQVGSDNDAPITPARQTRRTRKDSTSSVDKTAGTQIKEVILEEIDNTDKDKKNETEQDSPTRKSPRLTEKARSKISSSQPVVQIEKMDITNKKSKKGTQDEPPTEGEEEKSPSEKSNISVTSANLIKELDDAPNKKKIAINKSTNALYDEPLPKLRKNRTKSWTTISVEPTNDNNFCSDSEIFKKDNKKKNNSLNTSNMSGSGDGIMNTSEKENEDVNLSILSDKKNKKRQEKSIIMDNETSEDKPSTINESPKLKIATEVISEDTSASKDDKEVESTSKQDSNETEKLFDEAPAGLIQSVVYLEDSDSNHGNGKGNRDEGSSDQCVPFVVSEVGANETIKATANNLSYEPMDVDETLPENISQFTFGEKNNSIKLNDKENESPKRKSILNISQIKDDSLLNSKRKSSISNVVSEDIPDGSPNLSSRKSLDKSSVNDDSVTKKRKRNSSFDASKVKNIDGVTSPHTSKRNSLTTDDVKDESIDENSNKSRRKSKCEDSINKNLSTTLATALVFDDKMDTSLNKSKRQSSASTTVTEAIDKEKSLISDSVINEDIMNKSSNKSKEKASIINEVNDDKQDKSLSKSKNKSSILHETENHDKTDSENKSTLVLSQLKDTSEGELIVGTKLPKDSIECNSQLSKSVTDQNVTLDKETDKKNLSLTYLTSTPLHQKSLKKLGLQINSSIITPSSESKIDKKNATKNATKETSIISQEDSDSSDEEEDSEEESSLEKSNMIDDEAEEAGADYESGDSRDDDEREYEEQHEIVEKGETLDSDDEEAYSDEDYEKDSFIVSSDEEDNDLLSGSGDDLDMSDNELTMSTKSKIKYNERKSKEQKKASREMFEARHQSKTDKTGNSKSKKNNRQRLDSTSSESDNEVTAPPKNKRRQRIDSSQDISNVQSEADKSSSKKIVNGMSESLSDDNEIETFIGTEPRNKKRPITDSSQDSINVQSDAEKSLTKKKIAGRMSVSFCEDIDKEITICGDAESEIQNQDQSNAQTNADNTLSSKKKKMARRMSVSICEDNVTNKDDITIIEDDETEIQNQNQSNAQTNADNTLSSKKKKMSRRMSVSICEDKETNKDEITIIEDDESEIQNQDQSNVQTNSDKTLSSKKKKMARRMSVSICEDKETNKDDITIIEDDDTEIQNQNQSNVQTNADKTLSSKKKKIARRMSVSICEDKDKETNEEEEITIIEDAETDKVDPLTLQNVIKLEPKTPQKNFNISTVAVTSVDDAEQVNVDENATILESNQTSDPLQTTQIDDVEDNDEDEDSISENEEIAGNYESILKTLNSVTSETNNYRFEISLNLDKKTKKKAKEPIVDQLNLTQVKQKNKKQTAAVEDKPKTEKGKKTEKDTQVLVFSEGSSDSIELKLLFPEDSTDSDALVVTKGTNNKESDDIEKEASTEVADDFIPLKRTEGKTNMLENTETDNMSIEESVLNVSSKKKNKRKSTLAMESEDMNDQETNFNFFIDTTGNLNDANTSIKGSAKKNKKKNNISIVNIEGDIDTASDLTDSHKPDANTSVKESAKKNKKKNNISIVNIEGDMDTASDLTDSHKPDANTSVKESAKKNKKKNNISIVNIEGDIDTASDLTDSHKPDANTSVKESAKKNKKKNNISIVNIEGDMDTASDLTDSHKPDANTSVKESAKKNKKKNNISIVNIEGDMDTASDLTDSHKPDANTSVKESAKKKKQKSNVTIENIDTASDLTDSHKKNDANSSVKESAKKKKQKSNVSITEDVDTASDLTDSHKLDANTSVKGNAIEEDKNGNDSDDAPIEISYQSNKNTAQIKMEYRAIEISSLNAKKKKKNKKGLNKYETEEHSLFGNTDNTPEKSNNSIIGVSAKKQKLNESQVEQEAGKETTIQVQNVSISSSKKQKQKTVPESGEVVKETEGDKNVNNEVTTKKRKRKYTASHIEDIVIKDDLKLDTNKALNDATINQKKKRKILHNHEETEKSHLQEIVKESTENTKNARKKNKIGQNQAVNEIADGAIKINKKRKERDDDDPSKVSKVPKQNSFDKVHVPRLPASILKQLDDKPKTDAKKPNAISTTSFLVEQTFKRKTKPSNYLEQSVYLNDTVEERELKGLVRNPKVLPFVPTASTSDNGFTTKFKVNIIPQETQFVAQSSGVPNFKNDYLAKQRLKMLPTLEKYKRHRNKNVNLAKF